jgi:hypothetical protein
MWFRADAEPVGIDESIDWDSVGGLKGHITALKEMIMFPLLYPEYFERFNITPARYSRRRVFALSMPSLSAVTVVWSGVCSSTAPPALERPSWPAPWLPRAPRCLIDLPSGRYVPVCLTLSCLDRRESMSPSLCARALTA